VTLQDVIAIAGLFAASFSAAAAAFAVQQSKLQRTTLTKPQLIVTNIIIPVIGKSDEIFSFSPKDDQHPPYFKVPIKNVGLGTALNLKYGWDFDYRSALDACGFIHTDTHQMESLHLSFDTEKINNSVYVEEDIKNENSYFSFFKYGKFKAYASHNTYTNIEYIIPITQDKDHTFLTLPYLIPMLNINNSQNITSITEALLKEMQSGILKVEYEDISGCRFSIKFSCTIRLIRYSVNIKTGSEAEYELNLARIHNISVIKKLVNFIASKFGSPKTGLNSSKKLDYK